MSKYSYKIEALFNKEWVTILDDCRMQFGVGYITALIDYNRGPSPGFRLIRSDGRVLEEVDERTEITLGQIAGFPTASQYRAAGNRALYIADKIDETKERQSSRRSL